MTQANFNSYGARRGNHEVMMRGTFANIRIRNEMLKNVEGGMTKHLPSGEEMPIYDAAMRYKKEGVPLVIFGGKEYGTGSSRDWAAKGTMLLGVKAVVVESFERIHRSNLVGMGVLPLVFKAGTDRKSLGITGEEIIDITGLDTITPRMELSLVIHRPNGKVDTVPVICRIDTVDEVAYYQHGGILQYGTARDGEGGLISQAARGNSIRVKRGRVAGWIWGLPQLISMIFSLFEN